MSCYNAFRVYPYKVVKLTLIYKNVSTSIMSQDNENSGRAEDARGEDLRDDVLGSAREGASTRSLQMDLGLVPNRTLDAYRRECAGLMKVERFEVMVVDGKNLVVFGGDHFERDTDMGVLKRRWALLSQYCVGILVDTCSADLPFVPCEQGSFYCYRRRDAIDANMEVAEGDPGLQCWLFDELYTNMYFMCGGKHETSASKFESRWRTALCNSIFMGWQKLEMFAALPRDWYLHYVCVPSFWRKWYASHILCVQLPSMFAYESSAFGSSARRFGFLIIKTAKTKFTIVSFVCFIQCSQFVSSGSLSCVD